MNYSEKYTLEGVYKGSLLTQVVLRPRSTTSKEECDPSFKDMSPPRYSQRDMGHYPNVEGSEMCL